RARRSHRQDAGRMTRRKAASAWQGAASLPRGFFLDHTTIAWSPHHGRHHSAALAAHRALELERKLRHRRPPEQCPGIEIEPQCRVHPRDELRAAQRVTAEIEEVVVRADRRDAEYIGEVP